MDSVGKRLRPFALAIAATALVAVPARTGWAYGFSDVCGAHMFEAKDCTCMAGKVASDDDRANLMAFFQANIEATKSGGKPDENDPKLQKGFALLNDYLGKCM